MVYPEVETAANVILFFIDEIQLSLIVSFLKSLDVDVHRICNAFREL